MGKCATIKIFTIMSIDIVTYITENAQNMQLIH